MHRRHLPLVFECDLDVLADPGTRELTVHCSMCNRDVHQLSNMTEREARALIDGEPGAEICIAYRCDRAGRVAYLHRCQEPHDIVLTGEELGTVKAPREPMLNAVAVALGFAFACIVGDGFIEEPETTVQDGIREDHAAWQMTLRRPPKFKGVGGYIGSRPRPEPPEWEPPSPAEIREQMTLPLVREVRKTDLGKRIEGVARTKGYVVEHRGSLGRLAIAGAEGTRLELELQPGLLNWSMTLFDAMGGRVRTESFEYRISGDKTVGQAENEMFRDIIRTFEFAEGGLFDLGVEDRPPSAIRVYLGERWVDLPARDV